MDISVLTYKWVMRSCTLPLNLHRYLAYSKMLNETSTTKNERTMQKFLATRKLTVFIHVNPFFSLL
jgi:hypothetical protein